MTRITGTNGADQLVGGSADDVILAGDGNDTLDGGAGCDDLYGGGGSDYYIIRDRYDHVSDADGDNGGLIYADFYKPAYSMAYWRWADGVARLPYWLDAMLPEEASGFTKLLGSGKTFNYCFATSAPIYFDEGVSAGFAAFNAEQKAFARQAMDYISRVIDVSFVETASPDAHNTIVFANNDQGSSSSGYAYYPDGATYYGNDILLNNGQENTVPSATGYSALVLIHELGHALGLKHPFDDGNAEGPYLEPGEDSAPWTVMSYDSTPDAYALRFAPLDIAALQYLYGPSKAATGNDVYTLTANAANFIWDGAGVDTIDGSALTHGLNLFLEPGYWGYIGSKSSNIYAAGQVTVNFGTVIENVQGGQADDVIFGNGAANGICGGAGSDTIEGAAGDDVIDGGEGNDTALGLHGRDLFAGGAGEDRMILKQSASQMEVIKLRDGAAVVTDAGGANLVLCRDVERIYFADALANLGTAAIARQLDATLAQVYVAAFRRAPELSGYEYWAKEVAARGITAAADTIFSLDGVKALYPADMSAGEFVATIYANVFNRAPDAEGLKYWSEQVAASSRGQVVIDMTCAALHAADGTPGKAYFQNRVDWSLYALDYQHEQGKDMPITRLDELTAGIGADTAALITLIGQAESGAAI